MPISAPGMGRGCASPAPIRSAAASAELVQPGHRGRGHDVARSSSGRGRPGRRRPSAPGRPDSTAATSSGPAERVGLALDDDDRHAHGGELGRPGSSPAGPAGAAGRPAPARPPRPGRPPCGRPPGRRRCARRAPAGRSSTAVVPQLRRAPPASPRRGAAARGRSAGRPPATAARPGPPASRRGRLGGHREQVGRLHAAAGAVPEHERAARAAVGDPWQRPGRPERGVDAPDLGSCRGRASSASTAPARSRRRHVRGLVDRWVGPLAAREPGAGEAGPLRAQHVPPVRGDQRHAARGRRRRPRPPRGTPRGRASRPGSTSLDSDRSTSGDTPPRSSPASAMPGEPWVSVTTRIPAAGQPAQRRLDVRVRGQLAERPVDQRRGRSAGRGRSPGRARRRRRPGTGTTTPVDGGGDAGQQGAREDGGQQ